MEYYLQDRVAPSGFELHCKPHAAIWTRVPCNTAAMVVRAGPVHISFKSAESAMSAYSLVVAAASAAFALPGGIVSDKVGRLPVLAVCWLLGVRHRTSVAMLLHASALLSLVIGQAVSSVGFAFVSSFPIVLAIGLGFGATAGVSSGPFFALVADIAPNPVRNSLLKKPFPIPSPYDQTWWGAGSSLEGHEHLHVGVHDCSADRAVRMRWRHQLVQGRLCVRTSFGLLVHEM